MHTIAMMKYVEESDEVILRTDEVALIFGFLEHDEIMHARICTTWRDAAMQTTVPPSDFEVNDVKSYNAVRAMSRALPNLQQLAIGDLVGLNRYTEGEDPNNILIVSLNSAGFRTHNIDIVSNFSKLRKLSLLYSASLNGRYPALFNFPLLQELVITECDHLKVDLIVLARLTSLRKLELDTVENLTGNLSSLRALKDSLEIITITNSENVSGIFMDLADFPHLKELNLLENGSISGDIRDIKEHDFPAIERLCLPHYVVGGMGYEFQRISDVPEFLQSIHPLLKRPSNPFGKGYDWCVSNDYDSWCLSANSPDHYVSAEAEMPSPPFCIEFIHAGSRLGWSWYSSDVAFESRGRHHCEINWLDPEPSRDSKEYQAYRDKIQYIEKERDAHLYKGFTEPPTEEEYRLLCALSSGGNAYHL